ncbi:MAG: class I SAM-dependent methyltransferase [Spirochaetia bacterium]|nr:class I SAM-dependent methyltransferase [Spirochaetia bacterium]
MKKAASFWNTLAKRYDKQVSSKYSQAYMLTIEKTKKYLKATDVVLDYACGTGITTVQLADQVKEIHAIDFSQNMIVIASEKVAAEKIDNVRLAVGTITDPELKEKSFDVVLAFNILYFLDDLEAVLHRISHLLRNGGTFISVTDCLAETKSFTNTIQSFLSKIGVLPSMKRLKVKQLQAMIRDAGFSIIETENLHADPPNHFVVAIKA